MLSRAARPALKAGSAAAVRAAPSNAAGFATLREIEGRLKSIRNIEKITNTMKIVASTRLTRAQKAMEESRVYGQTSNTVFESAETKPLEDKKTLFVVASSDKGLCGGIHSSLSKATRRLLAGNENADIVVLGEKAKAQLSRSNAQNIVLSFSQVCKDIPTFADAQAIADQIALLPTDYASIQIIYNKFVNAQSYEATTVEAYSEEAITESPNISAFEVEEEALANLREYALANSLFWALAEGHACEISARRNAMENASKNAGEMIQKFQILYNRQRQAAITGELVEIITGATASEDINASAKDIDTAYKKLALKYHPDKSGNTDLSLAHFQQIQEAIEVLRDPDRKEKYDATEPLFEWEKVVDDIYKEYNDAWATWDPEDPDYQEFTAWEEARYKQTWQEDKGYDEQAAQNQPPSPQQADEQDWRETQEERRQKRAEAMRARIIQDEEKLNNTDDESEIFSTIPIYEWHGNNSRAAAEEEEEEEEEEYNDLLQQPRNDSRLDSYPLIDLSDPPEDDRTTGRFAGEIQELLDDNSWFSNYCIRAVPASQQPTSQDPFEQLSRFFEYKLSSGRCHLEELQAEIAGLYLESMQQNFVDLQVSSSGRLGEAFWDR
ncbi:F-type H+-transporting ATPase subunit gamma [Talaromyces islandicus]|uniref:ATP synthase subunit gamma, mitochondrial n=1 Tax=Talaromyces islandicus TaxID=28573 RepID=A0A0U1M4D8_TALIS|nr:F-type H+-transporting ATPase subunit gamma [Talaromyces islandicus]